MMLHSLDKVLGMPSNIRLASKNLQETNTLAYFLQLSVTTKKSFIRLSPGHNFGQEGVLEGMPVHHEASLDPKLLNFLRP